MWGFDCQIWLQGNNSKPPSAGAWAGMSPYLRIDLEGYTPLEIPVSFSTIRSQYGDEIRLEIVEDHSRHYPFATYGSTIRTAQGAY